MIVIDYIWGNCPVQAEGTIDGKPFYFRARYNSWTFGVGDEPVGIPDWKYEEEYGDDPFDAGWMSLEDVGKMIKKAVLLYQKDMEEK